MIPPPISDGSDEEYRERNCPIPMQIGDLVITKLRNRWGLQCAGIIKVLRENTADVDVLNFGGPGADVLITHIPLNELESSK